MARGATPAASQPDVRFFREREGPGQPTVGATGVPALRKCKQSHEFSFSSSKNAACFFKKRKKTGMFGNLLSLCLYILGVKPFSRSTANAGLLQCWCLGHTTANVHAAAPLGADEQLPT